MDLFPISPASPKPLWILGAICVLLAVILAALAYTAYATRNSRVEINHTRIRLVGDFWGRDIDFRSLDVPGARVVDLDRQSPFGLRRRTLGTGLPGYASGWFRLRNGEKALVYLTRRHGVVYLPTRAGYALLLSVEAPERFLATLQRRTSSDGA